jgi:two-component system NtrC family sensor kinase
MKMEEGDTAGQRARILLVDDQELVLRATASMLREFDVVTAGSGAEALDRLQRGHFDAVVSDVSMPGMSGPELFVRVCARLPHLAQRFLFLSGDRYGAVALIAACAARAKIAVVPQLLEKPVPRDALVREILGLTASQQLHSGTFEIPAASSIHAINAK